MFGLCPIRQVAQRLPPAPEFGTILMESGADSLPVPLNKLNKKSFSNGDR
jgi:hypothetical protein